MSSFRPCGLLSFYPSLVIYFQRVCLFVQVIHPGLVYSFHSLQSWITLTLHLFVSFSVLTLPSSIWCNHWMWSHLHSGIVQTGLFLNVSLALWTRQNGHILLSSMILFLSSGASHQRPCTTKEAEHLRITRLQQAHISWLAFQWSQHWPKSPLASFNFLGLSWAVFFGPFVLTSWSWSVYWGSVAAMFSESFQFWSMTLQKGFFYILVHPQGPLFGPLFPISRWNQTHDAWQGCIERARNISAEANFSAILNYRQVSCDCPFNSSILKI